MSVNETLKGKYRIVEKIYGDGHKSYTAQEAVKIFGITLYWKKFVIKEDNYYGSTIRFICCGNTYEDCYEYLLKCIDDKKKEKEKNTLKKINYYEY